MLLNIPVWEAVIDGGPAVSCEAVSLQSAAIVAACMIAKGQKVIALTDGEITIDGERFRKLMADPNAIHMHAGKLYDSSAELLA